MKVRNEGLVAPRKKASWGIPFLAALSIGMAGEAGAQNNPSRPDPVRAYLLAAEREGDTSWEIPDFRGVEDCRNIAAQEIIKVLRGKELNGGNLCSSDDVPSEIYRMNLEMMNKREAALTPTERAQKRAREEQMRRESDELTAYCESVNYTGKKCEGF